MRKMTDKQTEITMFSSTAIALYGYDQGESARFTQAICLLLTI